MKTSKASTYFKQGNYDSYSLEALDETYNSIYQGSVVENGPFNSLPVDLTDMTSVYEVVLELNVMQAKDDEQVSLVLKVSEEGYPPLFSDRVRT